MNFKEHSQIIKDCLNLKNNPVGVKLFKKEDEAKKLLPKINNKILHCQGIINASNGESFYGTVNELKCETAIQILGLKALNEDLLNGSKFNKMNVTKTQNAGKRLIKNTAKLDKKIEAIGYMPLENVVVKPDVVVILGKAKQIFNLIRANTYNKGERLENSVSGTQSLCGDIIINTYLNNKLNISYGCIGSRLASDLKDNEIAIGIPISKLEEITTSLKITKIPALTE